MDSFCAVGVNAEDYRCGDCDCEHELFCDNFHGHRRHLRFFLHNEHGGICEGVGALGLDEKGLALEFREGCFPFVPAGVHVENRSRVEEVNELRQCIQGVMTLEARLDLERALADEEVIGGLFLDA